MVKFTSENAPKNNHSKSLDGLATLRKIEAADRGRSEFVVWFTFRLPAMSFGPTSKAVILIGFMGAGKSSVGRALADALGWTFEDLDERIERREGRRVAEVFRDSGEAAFRLTEYAALAELLQELPSAPERIIALGGGAFVQEPVAALIEAAKIPTVFLDADVRELRQRCQLQSDERGTERPLLGSLEDFQRLYEQRRPHYLRAAVRQETAGKSVETVVEELIRGLRLDSAVSRQTETG